ncbi:MAG: hypothetical protein R3229_16900 [Alphaproteobacteria bacterium]|nr:hypothetical protein [Alphaproteobacteria bacterium]
MTVVVGILCENGVAIAADRQTTNTVFLPVLSPKPIQTSTGVTTKVSRIGNGTLFGISGSLAVGQEYEQLIIKCENNFSKNNYDRAVKNLKNDVVSNVKSRFETAKVMKEAVGEIQAYCQSVCECVFATNFKDGHKLVQIVNDGVFDVADDSNPVRVIGSGQLHADPFAAFLKNTFWPNKLPTLEEGILAAVWAVDYAIEVGAQDVGQGIDAFAVNVDGRKSTTRQLNDSDLQGHKDFIGEAREQLRELANLRIGSSSDAKRIPTIKK